MRNALLIAVREFLDNTQTRGFWFGILLVPLLWLMASQVPLILARKGTPTRHLALIDATAGEHLFDVVLHHLKTAESRRELFHFREWVAPRLKSGQALPAADKQPQAWSKLQEDLGPLMKVDAGRFAPPAPLNRLVALPPELEWRGHLSEFEGRLRDWMREERLFKPVGVDEEVPLFAVAILQDGPSSNAPPILRFWSANQADTQLQDRIVDALSRNFRSREYTRLGMDPSTIAQVEGSQAQLMSFNPRKAEGEE